MALNLVLAFAVLSLSKGSALVNENAVSTKQEDVVEADRGSLSEDSAGEGAEPVESANAVTKIPLKIEIISPAPNSEYCIGDTIPIVFKASKEIEAVQIGTKLYGQLGTYRTVRDTSEDMPTTEIDWDQSTEPFDQIPPDYTHQIQVYGSEISNSRNNTLEESGYFSIIDCNI